ncbi:PREDICTED: staphylococcal nuclease domain-containing protein 1 [Bactrocera latifrons]|uniref:Staphylococcal nuclease domain-containing protein 1 n=2 Tax=Bactrocera latifrons TaxID=174628 RepID=A0A0K8WD72_BACLA|nr:PREDICTED: staphylococcal nuclease domain-containing protein 1 [Bactrocera latifrons]
MSGPASTSPATATNKDGDSASSAPKRRGIVKQVLSGDTVVIRALKGAPPPEKQITFSYVLAPKLARRPGAGGDETKDEPWAWDSREFLRKKLIGEEVLFSFEKPANSNREYGFVWLGKDAESGENVVETMVREGYVTVRREGRPSSELQRLIELEDQAKSANRGKWSHVPPVEKVRHIKWTQENPAHIVELYGGKPVKAIIEHVRDGSTVRAFLLPDFQYITLMISGIRCPGVKLDADGKPDLSVKIPFADEARFYVESRLLQREVEIRLESVNNSNFIGTILFPKGNIAESLLREGLAKCVDWSMAVMKSGAEKLRAAERTAKEKRLRLWQDYQSKAPTVNAKEKDFTGTVVEVFNGDAISVRLSNGQVKKVFFSSIRPPRDQRSVVGAEGEVSVPLRGKNYRPLYEIPFMFEAREFLRKKLINKKVQCNLDYISPARDNFPEKYCYTVNIGGQNVAEAMVAKGLATCVRHRQDDDQRSSVYDQLLAAESQAIKGQKGMFGKKDNVPLRINDLTVDHSRIKVQYLPSWQRALRTEAIVEFVASGSRLRLYVPKDSCLVTFLLAGISCPRSSRPALSSPHVPAQDGEPYGEEALAFTRDRVLQRDVSVHIDTTDKAGSSVIGWLWTDNNVNLSVALVEEGLAEVHFSAEKSEYYRQLKNAEDRAKAAKKNIWANYVEQVIEEKPVVVEEEKDEKVPVERKVHYEDVIVTEITADLTFFAQAVENGAKLEAMMAKLHAEFQSNPPIVGAYTPKRGDVCAAQFSADNQWYRAKIERLQGNNATVLYIDYGNKETVPTSRLASLPAGFSSDRPYATEYALALVQLPSDNEDKEEALRIFAEDVLNRTVKLNVELKPATGPALATVHDPATNVDIGKQLVADGYVLAEKRRERKLKDLVEQYRAAQQAALAAHLVIWKYGDITQDDAPEFSR